MLGFVNQMGKNAFWTGIWSALVIFTVRYSEAYAISIVMCQERFDFGESSTVLSVSGNTSVLAKGECANDGHL